MRRRYEVWFVRCGMADSSGAWWFRYLLVNNIRISPENARSPALSGFGPLGFPAAQHRRVSSWKSPLTGWI